jgi:hypothetical protein
MDWKVKEPEAEISQFGRRWIYDVKHKKETVAYLSLKDDQKLLE